ncbi:Rhodanese-like domain-containing protein [Dunaliella salina]|uniref:Rhodanese-like domain-containing protein n=1 Tax=Dunaliella salina TaxID=3046 RepID=A0ABQ7GCH3_DUNSA|nr:Rhodanese-like domain-containing protein [Dunaliella salina]|eukprot:KAF5832306.1 Rhodanese-like domain-containing protein [Dunaliella salina]
MQAEGKHKRPRRGPAKGKDDDMAMIVRRVMAGQACGTPSKEMLVSRVTTTSRRFIFAWVREDTRMQTVSRCSPSPCVQGLAPTRMEQAPRLTTLCNLRASHSRPSPTHTSALPANKVSLAIGNLAKSGGVDRRALLQAGLASIVLGYSGAANAGAENQYAEAVQEVSHYIMEISPSQLYTLSQRMDSMPPTQRNSPNSPRLIDVRTPEEYKSGHVPNTMNVSYTNDQDFEARIMPMLKGVDKSADIVLVCASTKRSLPAVKILQHAGFRNAMQLAKGMQEYSREGLPVAV